MTSKKANENGARVQITPDGPYVVSGDVPLAKEMIVSDSHKIPIDWKAGDNIPAQEPYYLCRCGGSNNKPFCDGTHKKNGFNGKETAGHAHFQDQAELYEGPGLDLADDQDLCAGLQFCHRAGGEWNLIEKTDDPETKKVATEIATRCASGRLVVIGKDGKEIEPDHNQSISVVEDPGKGVSGPLWVKGKIPVISADGEPYESRNRVTLCRCGGSENKPFCDGTHIAIHFNDVDKKAQR